MLTYNAKLGLVLFTIYTILYAGFVLLNAFAASVMETEPIAGVNLAIIYGFALIVGAFLMALLYGALCRDQLDFDEQKSGKKEPPKKPDPDDISIAHDATVVEERE